MQEDRQLASNYFYWKDILLTGCLNETTFRNEMTDQSAGEKVIAV